MLVVATRMRDRGRPRDKRAIEADAPARGDLGIAHVQSAEYGRTSKVASFHRAGAADPELLPPLHDVELSWMGPLGFVLTGIEFIDGSAYGQSWWCRPA